MDTDNPKASASVLMRVHPWLTRFESLAFALSLLVATPLLAQVASAPDAAQRLAALAQAGALSRAFNYDEAKVRPFTLPDPLVTRAGRRVTTAELWWQERRPEILQLFTDEVYGRAPAPPRPVTWKVTAVDRSAFGGKATRKLVTVHLLGRDDGPTLELLIYLPNARPAPAPAFVALNYGNHTLSADPGVPVSPHWQRDQSHLLEAQRAQPGPDGQPQRGTWARRWPIERILERGYALVTFYAGDLDPDINDGFLHGIQRAFYAAGQTQPAANEWGFLSAWAWGYSRALDYLVQDRDLDAQRIAVTGHSRFGKTALWAGALDPRFALVVSSCSGLGGAKLARRNFGESVQWANFAQPDRFARNFQKYGGREDTLPVDQHLLLALIAPRPLLIVSASEDNWADPKGEFLSAKHASPVYRLLGTDGLSATEMPAAETFIPSTLGYYRHTGIHDVTPADWERYLDFADRHLPRSK